MNIPMAPWAMLKIPEVAYVTTRPLAAMAYAAPVTMPMMVKARESCMGPARAAAGRSVVERAARRAVIGVRLRRVEALEAGRRDLHVGEARGRDLVGEVG